MKNKSLIYIILILLILAGCKFTAKQQKPPLKYELVTINCRVPEYEPESGRKLIVPNKLVENDITQLIISGEFIFDEGYTLEDFSDEEKKYFKFTQTFNSQNEESAIALLKQQGFTLAKGNWNFKLEAKTTGPENTLQTAAVGENKNLNIESATSITFEMQKLNSGDGYYSANISFPFNGADKVLYIVIPSEKTLENFTEHDYTKIDDFNQNVTAGVYNFNIEDKQISGGLYYLYLAFYKNSQLISVNTVYFQVAPGHKTEIEQNYIEINTPYTITYVMSSDSDNVNKPKWTNSSTNITYTFNSSMNITLPDEDDITRENYIFEGWYESSDFSGTPIAGWPAGEKKEDVILYAKWKPVTKGKIKVSTNDNIEFSLSKDITSLEEETTIDIIATQNGKIIVCSDYTVYVYLNDQIIIDSSSANKIENSYVKYDDNNKKLTFKKSAMPLDFIVSVSAKYNNQLYSANMGVTCRKWYEYKKTGDLNGLSGEVYVKVKGDTELPTKDECNAINGSLILDLTDSNKTTLSISGCTTLKKVILPQGLEKISYDAFKNCESLTDITIPESVTSIGSSAFYDCTSLTNITIPESVTSINQYTFYNCESLTDITIPESVTSIGSYAFRNCKSLTNITIPESVTSIGSSAFYDCTSLTNITIPESVTSINQYTFYNCESLTNITIPDSVTSIGSTAFYNCTSLTNITILGGVKIIDDYAFYNCKALTNITIPNSVTKIGNSAFQGCSSLTDITIPESVTSIGSYAFRNCKSLTNITIPESVTSIGSSVFSSCTSLTSITIPNSVTSIGSSAFYNCTSLTNITIPDSVKIIDDYAFYNCESLTNVTIPYSVTSIGSAAFQNCTSLTNITIPESVTSIGGYAFQGCSSLTDITIPESVTSIGGYAFERCTSLTNITIPDSVTSIGYDAFYGCSNLSSVTVSEDQNWEVGSGQVTLEKDNPSGNAEKLKNSNSSTWTRQ